MPRKAHYLCARAPLMSGRLRRKGNKKKRTLCPLIKPGGSRESKISRQGNVNRLNATYGIAITKDIGLIINISVHKYINNYKIKIKINLGSQYIVVHVYIKR